MGLPYGENSIILTPTLFVWSTRVTDGQTDRRTDGRTGDSIYAIYVLSRVKIHSSSINTIISKNRIDFKKNIISANFQKRTISGYQWTYRENCMMKQWQRSIKRRLVALAWYLWVTQIIHIRRSTRYCRWQWLGTLGFKVVMTVRWQAYFIQHTILCFNFTSVIK